MTEVEIVNSIMEYARSIERRGVCLDELEDRGFLDEQQSQKFAAVQERLSYIEKYPPGELAEVYKVFQKVSTDLYMLEQDIRERVSFSFKKNQFDNALEDLDNFWHVMDEIEISAHDANGSFNLEAYKKALMTVIPELGTGAEMQTNQSMVLNIIEAKRMGKLSIEDQNAFNLLLMESSKLVDSEIQARLKEIHCRI